MLTPDEIRKGRALADLAGVDESSIIRKALDAAEKLNKIEDAFGAYCNSAEGLETPRDFVNEVFEILEPNRTVTFEDLD